mmetsp:Transcript_26106/g.60468  ORF Transcript_26106/g.60468 Transcript_26106/m.60468 type:complete len:242 (+) Transcript_26106:236-961(+)
MLSLELAVVLASLPALSVLPMRIKRQLMPSWAAFVVAILAASVSTSGGHAAIGPQRASQTCPSTGARARRHGPQQCLSISRRRSRLVGVSAKVSCVGGSGRKLVISSPLRCLRNSYLPQPTQLIRPPRSSPSASFCHDAAALVDGRPLSSTIRGGPQHPGIKTRTTSTRWRANTAPRTQDARSARSTHEALSSNACWCSKRSPLEGQWTMASVLGSSSWSSASLLGILQDPAPHSSNVSGP